MLSPTTAILKKDMLLKLAGKPSYFLHGALVVSPRSHWRGIGRGCCPPRISTDVDIIRSVACSSMLARWRIV
eukprot:6722901-Pyramimonas_sp.AAC.1